jgi:GxxExxY protein
VPLLHSDVTDSILGAFYAVYNELRYGYLEAVYSSALEVEFQRRRVPYVREMLLAVKYKGHGVGLYRADFLVAGCVVVEVKATRQLGDADKRQLLNYLRTTGTRVGLILHFGPRAAFHRTVFTLEERSA